MFHVAVLTCINRWPICHAELPVRIHHLCCSLVGIALMKRSCSSLKHSLLLSGHMKDHSCRMTGTQFNN